VRKSRQLLKLSGSHIEVWTKEALYRTMVSIEEPRRRKANSQVEQRVPIESELGVDEVVGDEGISS
jgi:hypothetical protein